MDMIFVDADHTYPSVINDTGKALRMLRKDEPGKVILWHDSRQRSDVERGILELCDLKKDSPYQGYDVGHLCLLKDLSRWAWVTF